MILFLAGYGTLTAPCPRDRASSPEMTELALLPGVQAGLTQAQRQGYRCIGVANEGGVACGQKTLDQAIAQQQYTLQLLPQLEMIYICPDWQGQQCWRIERERGAVAIHEQPCYHPWVGTFRKPGTGMIEVAIAQCGAVVRERCWLIGDDTGPYTPDSSAAAQAGIPFLLAAAWQQWFSPDRGSTSLPLTAEQLAFLQAQ